MAICKRLEASLTTTAATRRRLLDALLAEALALPPISGNDIWVRVVEMLQQNWAAIEAMLPAPFVCTLSATPAASSTR